MTKASLCRSAVVSVSVVAVTAAAISYVHTVAAVRHAGEPSALAYAYPFCIDALIAAASIAVLAKARAGKSADSRSSRIAYGLLSAGIAVSAGLNMLEGSHHGILGVAVAAWPALAFAGSFELLVRMIRDQRKEPLSPLFESALAAYPDGDVPTLASIRRTLQVGDTRAHQVRDFLASR